MPGVASTGVPAITIWLPVPVAAFSFRPVPPESMPFVPSPKTAAREVLSEMNLDVFTTEIENSTMNSTSSRVSMSA